MENAEIEESIKILQNQLAKQKASGLEEDSMNPPEPERLTLPKPKIQKPQKAVSAKKALYDEKLKKFFAKQKENLKIRK